MISAISVKDRLKNRAVANGKTFQDMLMAFGLESIFKKEEGISECRA